jgi:hypothetical protein
MAAFLPPHDDTKLRMKKWELKSSNVFLLFEQVIRVLYACFWPKANPLYNPLAALQILPQTLLSASTEPWRRDVVNKQVSISEVEDTIYI